MRIKSYFAGTVEAALGEARRDLGPEAILIESRRSSPESRRMGAYEVVCAVAPAANPKADAGFTAGARDTARAHSETGRLERRAEVLDAFLDRLEGLAGAFRKTEFAVLRLAAGPETKAAVDLLDRAEIDPKFISGLLNEAKGSFSRESLLAAIERSVRADCTLGQPGSARKIVALVGPPGAGKTTTLVKLAARYGVGARKPCLTVSVDTQRVASSETLRAYAAILGTGFRSLDTAKALAQTIAEFRTPAQPTGASPVPGRRTNDWMWIDTPGLSRKEMEDSSEWIDVLAGVPDIDTHLVLPASMRTADLSRTVDRFMTLRPSKLLFTRLDETDAYGALFNESARTGLPLSFLAGGPQIPEDLEEANSTNVAELILRETPRGARSASAAA